MNPDYFLIEQFCNAGVNNIDYAIPPEASPDNTIVTLEQGFPPLMEIKPNEGGVPVPRQGFNGILRALSNIIAYQNKGGLFTFNPENVTGYNTGAVLWNPATNQFVKSLKDANTDNYIEFPQFIDGQSWEFVSDNSGTLPYATTLIAGIIKIATQQMVDDGTDNTTVVTPLTLANAIGHIDLSLYAKLLSPFFQGNPRAPTSRFGDSSNSIATTEFVNGIFNIGAGYIVFPNGFAIQWGTTQIPPNYDSLEVALPLRYDAGFACANAITQAGANPIGTRFKDTAYEKIILSNGAPNSATVTWITLGLWTGAQVTGFDFKQFSSNLTVNFYWSGIFYNKFFAGGVYSQNTFLDTAVWAFKNGTSGVNPTGVTIFNPYDKTNQLVLLQTSGGAIATGIWVSNENSQGANWTQIRNGINGVGIDINTDKNPPTIMCGLLRSIDNGNSWNDSTGAIASINAVRYLGEYDGKYRWLSYQGGNGTALLSDDDGATWQNSPLPFSYGGINGAFPVVFKKYKDMQFSAPSNVNNFNWGGNVPLYSTIDNGNSWQSHTTPANVKIIAGFNSQFTGKYIYIALLANGNLAFSYDLNTWTNTGISNMLVTTGGTAVLEQCGGYMLFAGNVQGQDSKIWATKDGENWYTTNFSGVGGNVQSLTYSDYSGAVLVSFVNGRAWYSYTPELT